MNEDSFVVSTDDGLVKINTMSDAKEFLEKYSKRVFSAIAEARELRAKSNQKNHTELRDTFAAAALTGIISNAHRSTVVSDNIQPGEWVVAAYNTSDAMLRQREVTK